MFNHNFFKHKTIVQFATTAGIAILIYLYAVAQGFTLPLHFESHPKPKVLGSQTHPTPLRQGSAGQVHPTPTTSANIPTPQTFSNVGPTNSSLPAAAAIHASEVAQEVANVPDQVTEIANQGATKVLEQTQQTITTVNGTVNKLKEKIIE